MAIYRILQMVVTFIANTGINRVDYQGLIENNF